MLFRKIFTPFTSLLLITALVLIFSIMRATGALGPASLRWLLPLSFCLMTLLPWILLTAEGRQSIGLKKPALVSDFGLAIISGLGAAIGCFLLGLVLFGHSIDNWFVNIANNYKSMMDTSGMSFLMLNLIFTIPALIFSPIGEEIFYRGVLQKTLEQKLSITSSTIIECSLFALIHLVHHGIIKTETGLGFLPVSGFLWMVQMFLVAWMFSWLREKSGSIYVAILAHMMFNLAMNISIFLFLW